MSSARAWLTREPRWDQPIPGSLAPYSVPAARLRSGSRSLPFPVSTVERKHDADDTEAGQHAVRHVERCAVRYADAFGWSRGAIVQRNMFSNQVRRCDQLGIVGANAAESVIVPDVVLLCQRLRIVQAQGIRPGLAAARQPHRFSDDAGHHGEQDHPACHS